LKGAVSTSSPLIRRIKGMISLPTYSERRRRISRSKKPKLKPTPEMVHI
jgi:hypothetical protein